jgi:mannose-6-phosphate isomerase-like protein (cupin superfamily)
VLVVPPGAGGQHWHPQPANGWIEVLASPRLAGAPAGFSAGLQVLSALGKMRQRAHPAQTEVFWVVEGRALARLDGAVRWIEAGTLMVAPPHARQGFINEAAAPFRLRRLFVPAGLEDFFVGIGRPKRPGEPDPTPGRGRRDRTGYGVRGAGPAARVALGHGAVHRPFGVGGAAPRSGLTPRRSRPRCFVVGNVACARGRPPPEGKRGWKSPFNSRSVPSSRQRRKRAKTVGQGGKRRGSMRHAQPERTR